VRQGALLAATARWKQGTEARLLPVRFLLPPPPGQPRFLSAQAPRGTQAPPGADRARAPPHRRALGHAARSQSLREPYSAPGSLTEALGGLPPAGERQLECDPRSAPLSGDDLAPLPLSVELGQPRARVREPDPPAGAGHARAVVLDLQA